MATYINLSFKISQNNIARLKKLKVYPFFYSIKKVNMKLHTEFRVTRTKNIQTDCNQ